MQLKLPCGDVWLTDTRRPVLLSTLVHIACAGTLQDRLIEDVHYNQGGLPLSGSSSMVQLQQQWQQQLQQQWQQLLQPE